MKKKYIKPGITLVHLLTENIMNAGSIVTADGKHEDSLGQTEGGNKDSDGTVWGDAKKFNPWMTWDK